MTEARPGPNRDEVRNNILSELDALVDPADYIRYAMKELRDDSGKVIFPRRSLREMQEYLLAHGFTDEEVRQLTPPERL